MSTLYEYQPAKLVAYRDLRETLRCKCGEEIVTAPGPTNWQEKSRYGVGFVAHVVTAKCADSIPVYRLEKEFERLGVPVSRSTMTDMFHNAADVLEPLSERLLQLVRGADVVHADQTPLKVQAEGACRSGYIWNSSARRYPRCSRRRRVHRIQRCHSGRWPSPRRVSRFHP